jgi:hypothetical protein
MTETPTMRAGLKLAILLAGASLLGACQKHSEPPARNRAVEAPPTPVPAHAAEPAAKPMPKPAPRRPAKPPKPSADEQMLDDADATGMTSHASRGGDGSDASGNSQP